MSDETTTNTPPEPTPAPEATMPSDYHALLPEALREAPFLRPSKDGVIPTVEEVVASLENMGKLKGNMAESHIKIPAPDAADEDKKVTRDRILSLWTDLREVTEDEDTMPPAEVAGYKLPDGGDVLDSVAIEEIATFALAHKWGQQQFADYASKMIENQAAGSETQAQWKAAQSEKLASKLGEAKEQNVLRVASALEHSGASPEYIKALKEGNIDADLVLVLNDLVGKMVAMGDEANEFVQQVNTDARQKTPDEHHDAITALRTRAGEIQKASPEYRKITLKIQEHMKLALGT